VNPPSPNIHPIERESFEILSTRLDLSGLPSGERAVVGRIIHATADLDFASSMVFSPGAVEAGIVALGADAPVICDVEMLRVGLTALHATCFLQAVSATPSGTPTRSALGIRKAAEEHPDGGIFVIGCAPTALFEALRLISTSELRPALVVGLPVGFVGAAESKEALRACSAITGIPAISNVGEKGGSAAAAGALNALFRLAQSLPSSSAPAEHHEVADA
jgi:precorrin isomerase